MSEMSIEDRERERERNRVHIDTIDLVTGQELHDRILYRGTPIHGFIMVYQNSEENTPIEIIPVSSIAQIKINEEEKMKVNFGYYLGEVIK